LPISIIFNFFNDLGMIPEHTYHNGWHGLRGQWTPKPIWTWCQK